MRPHNVVTPLFLLCTIAIGCGDTPSAPPVEPRVESVTLSATVIDVADGSTATLTATVRDQHGAVMTGQAIAWTSGDPSIATVDNGTVSGQRPGTVQVTAAAGTRNASAAVTVKPVAVALERAGGEDQQGTVGLLLADSIRVRAVDRHGSGVAGVGVQFVVVAGDGAVTAATVLTDAGGHAATRWSLGSASGGHVLEARAPGLTGSPLTFAATAVAGTIVALTLAPDSVLLTPGSSAQLQAQAFDAFGNVAAVPLEWSSLHPSVVHVSSAGLVSALQDGTAHVVARSGTVADTAKVVVRRMVASVSLAPPSSFLMVGSAHQFTATALDATQVEVPVDAFTWMSSAPNVATVSNAGLVSALSPGTAVITAMVDDVPGYANVHVMTSAQTVAIGDTVYDSLAAGAVAAYTFAGSAGQEINVFFRQVSGTHPLYLSVYDHYSTPVEDLLIQMESSMTTDLYQNSFGRVDLPRTGEYTILIRSCCGPSASSYAFQVFPINRAPEGRPAAIAVGDTIVSELFPTGDIDEFTFNATAGQEVNIFFQQLAGDGVLELHVYDRYGTPQAQDLQTIWSGVSNDLHRNHSGRLRLPRTGTYTIVVVGVHWGSDAGSYRFQVFPIDRAPELVSAAVLIGDTIDGERIFPKGDIDEFTFSGTAGQDINVFFQQVDGDGLFHLELYDRYGTEDESVLTSVVSNTTADLYQYHSGRRTLPRDGQYTLVVSAAHGDVIGAYRVHVAPIDHAPEHVPSHISIGQTVTGERIFPKGDVDRFTFEGYAGMPLVLFLQPYGGSGDLELQVIDHSSLSPQAVIATASASNTENIEQYGTGPFLLPSTGTYSIVVTGAWSDRDATGSYRLRLRHP